MDIVEDADDDAMNLLDLDVNCLSQIFKKLEFDEIFPLLGTVCKTFDELCYQRLSDITSAVIDIRTMLSVTAQQFSLLGPSLTKLEMTGIFDLYQAVNFRFLYPICCHEKLQSLTLKNICFTEDYLECLLKVAKTLQFLDISFCDLTDHFLAPILAEAVNLRKLKLLGNLHLVCESLEYLNVEHIEEVEVFESFQNKDQLRRFREKHPELNIKIV